MALFRHDTFRRRGVRKNLAREKLSVRGVLRSSRLWTNVAISTVFVLMICSIAIATRHRPEYGIGEIVDRNVSTRVTFSSLNEKAKEQRRLEVRGQTPNVYQPNTQFLSAMREGLRGLPLVAASVDRVEDVAEEIRTQWGLNAASFAALKGHVTDNQPNAAWSERVDRLMTSLSASAFLDVERYQTERTNSAAWVRVMSGDINWDRVFDEDLVSIGDPEQIGKRVELIAAPFSEPIRRIIATYLSRSSLPTAILNQEASEQLKKDAGDRAAAEVKPTVYEPGQTVVNAGARLSADGYDLLLSEEEAYQASLGWVGWFAQGIGPVLLSSIVTVLIVLVIGTLRPRIGENPMRALAMALLLLMTVALAAGMSGVTLFGVSTAAASAVLACVLTAVILAVAYDRRLGAAIAGLHAVLIAVALGLTVGTVLAMFGAAVATLLLLAHVKDRGTLIRAGVVGGVAAAIGVFAAGAAERELVPGMVAAIGVEAAMAAGAAVFVGFFVLGILPFIERIFKVTTALTLIELCDVNQPLLKRMAQVAPGTYNHSLQVGLLVDAAAAAIGADRRLARAGAYYHDVGKMNKPQYFVENQSGGGNPHEKVSPAMSLLIIVGHVKDGIELAREYGVPSVLHHFIESHHGTTLVEYFFHEAKQKAKREGKDADEHPTEFEYRYPGPKPRSKEAAIMMLADAAESASRTLSEPTATRIEQLINKLSERRLADGQFDECDITLAELRRVQDALVKTLVSIYHGRIAYPKREGESGGGRAPETTTNTPPTPGGTIKPAAAG